MSNQPRGFVSKYSFVQSDLAAKARTIQWFARCGQPLDLDLKMPTERIADWPTAIMPSLDGGDGLLQPPLADEAPGADHVGDHADFQSHGRLLGAITAAASILPTGHRGLSRQPESPRPSPSAA